MTTSPGRQLRHGWISARPPLALPGQRIGLLGGSFNPPHAGHVQITEIALARLRLDRVWWLVTPGNPLKNNNDLPSQHERMAHCRRLAADPRVIVTGFEADLGTPYTAATVRFLTQRYPATRFVWLMGADNLASFERWKCWRDIAARVPLAVIDRPGWRLPALASVAARTLQRARRPESHAVLLARADPPAWTMLSGPLSPLSSTALRLARARLLRNGDGIVPS